MKKFLFTVMSMLLISLSVMANDSKLRVAIFDPIVSSTNMDNDIMSSIREIITSTIVNSGKYNTVERSLLEKVFQEQAFSNSGVVDDSNAVEIGKLTGANKVVVSLVSPSGSKTMFSGTKHMVSIKIIDVKTANIDKQKVKVIKTGDLLNEIAAITKELVNVDEAVVPEQTNMNFKAEKSKTDSDSEFVLHLAPGYVPSDVSHKDNYIEVILNGDVVGGGTLSEGFDIRIKEKKHKKYKLEIRPTSTSEDGKIDTKSGKTQYNIDTFKKQRFEFMLQSQRKGKWTIYTVRLK
ncbi:MAG: CsgG/HfaB family protein [Muribaculaceae bacterium]|nr:CsgG/HfaB family protein [Muribaculaceae bacterium]